MNNIALERHNQHLKDEAAFKKQKEKEDLDSKIMSHVRYLEDRGDAVAESEHVGRISNALSEAHAGVRTPALCFKLEILRRHIETQTSGVYWQGGH